MIKKIFTTLLLAATISPAFGEYRVYQYYVRTKIDNINPANATIVTSTLNPTSYAAYHGGKLSLEVNLLRSWVCMGDTSKQSVCSISEGKELKGSLQ
ncbi:MAG: hypothetical protein H7336_12490 [Bacteriovorax sp.]|nr:hypothetical protein [Bacteriovorax sp.]